MYNITSNEHEINSATMIADFEMMMMPLPAVNGTMKRVSIKNMVQLKHATSEQLNTLYGKIFGETMFNPYAERQQMIFTISKFMTAQMVNLIAALSGHAVDTYQEFAALDVDGRRNWDFAAMGKVEKEVEIVKPARVETELDFFFSAENMAAMGVKIEVVASGLQIISKKPVRRAALTIEEVKNFKRIIARGGHWTEAAAATGISEKTAARIANGWRYTEIEI